MHNFFDMQLKLEKTHKYDNPHMIVFSGLPGSGKTRMSKKLSQKLEIFLLSNDYIRNYYQQRISSKKLVEYIVKIVNLERMTQIIMTKNSFILDASISKQSKLKELEFFSQFIQYDLIKIRIHSNDNQQNIERVMTRKTNLTNIDKTIFGDNMEYSKTYTEEEYWRILANKQIEIDDRYFDYCITNDGTLNEFDQKIESVITDIQNKRLIRKF